MLAFVILSPYQSLMTEADERVILLDSLFWFGLLRLRNCMNFELL